MEPNITTYDVDAIDRHKLNYDMLTILLKLAPNREAQETVTNGYHELYRNDESDSRIMLIMAGWIVDGIRYGNWPWVVANLNPPPEVSR